MRKYLFTFFGLCAVGLFFTGCYSSRPVAKQQPYNNETYRVDYLFEHEGVKVYRFNDRGNEVYFTSPASVVTAIDRDLTEHRVTTIIGRE